MPLDLSRRRFFGFLAAPAIVRATSLMPISVFLDDDLRPILGLSHGQIRDLLFPGLQTLKGNYAAIAPQWESVFGRVA